MHFDKNKNDEQLRKERHVILKILKNIINYLRDLMVHVQCR